MRDSNFTKQAARENWIFGSICVGIVLAIVSPLMICAHRCGEDARNRKICYEFDHNGTKSMVIGSGFGYKSIGDSGISISGVDESGHPITLNCSNCAVREWDCGGNGD